MKKIEKIILKNLFLNEQYARKILPYLKTEYLLDRSEKLLFEEIQSFVLKYNKVPTNEAIGIAIGDREDIFEEEYKKCSSILDEIKLDPEVANEEWLLHETEKFCQERAIHNAIMESIQILDGKDKNQVKTKGAIPEILSEALSISFDPNIGHDYIVDSDERWNFYHKVEKRISFDLDYFNKITKGGIPQKTLNICLAGTGVGKSMFMCHMAASCIMQNYNVLYITLEMAEERIAERIDANLLNVRLDDLGSMPQDMYRKKINRLRDTVKGKLIIKEYPTASASSIHFRNLLNELNLKKGFKPDIIFIDYLNICASARIKHGANVNSYSYIKAIAEELRGLAVEYSVPIMSATQTTRTGFSNSDPGLEDTSESFGLPATADFMFALVATEDLDSLNQIMVKQLKNRYNDPNLNKRFVLGVDRAKMKFFDATNQTHLNDSGQPPKDTGDRYAAQNSDDRKTKFKSLKT